MQVVSRLRCRRNFGVYTLDRSLVECSDGRQVGGQPAPQADGIGATVLGFLVVQEGVWLGGDDLVRQDRGFGGVATVDAHLARFDALQ